MAFTQQTKVVKIHLQKTKVVRIHLQKTRRTCLKKICSPDISVHTLQNLSITILSPRDRKLTRQSYKYCAQTKEMYVISPTRITYNAYNAIISLVGNLWGSWLNTTITALSKSDRVVRGLVVRAVGFCVQWNGNLVPPPTL